MTPQYKVLNKLFIAPHTIQVGSIIETDMEPSGDNMEPLNEAARAKMEHWYERKVEVKDVDGKVTRTVYPNRDKRPGPEGEVLTAPTVTLVSAPPKDDSTPLVSLAQAQIEKATPGDLNPTGTSNPEPLKKSVDGKTTILVDAPEPKKVA